MMIMILSTLVQGGSGVPGEYRDRSHNVHTGGAFSPRRPPFAYKLSEGEEKTKSTFSSKTYVLSVALLDIFVR